MKFVQTPHRSEIIEVGAAAAEFPAALEAQLAPGGKMVIPVGVDSQTFYAVRCACGDSAIQKSGMKRPPTLHSLASVKKRNC